MRKSVSRPSLKSPTLIPQLLMALKRELRARGLHYSDVAKSLKISEITVKRYLSGAALTVEMLERLCEVIDLDLLDLLDAVKEKRTVEERPFTPAQEERFAREPILSVLYFLMLRGWRPEDVQREFDFSEAQFTRLLTTLDSLDLITLHPFNKVRVKAAQLESLRGPVKRLFRSMGVNKTVSEFDVGAGENRWIYNYYKLSQDSIDQLASLAEKLHATAKELERRDQRGPGRKTSWQSMFTLVRPYDLVSVKNWKWR
jgi:transcriptional regulator with XRE-family HTH domain